MGEPLPQPVVSINGGADATNNYHRNWGKAKKNPSAADVVRDARKKMDARLILITPGSRI